MVTDQLTQRVIEMAKIIRIVCSKCPKEDNEYIVDLDNLNGRLVYVDSGDGGNVAMWQYTWTCPKGHPQVIEVSEEFKAQGKPKRSSSSDRNS
jgi:hypothetical protein